MVYDELHIHHYLVLDQNENDNSYSTPLRHDFWNKDHRIVMLGIHLCYNTLSHVGVQYQHYLEHDNVYLSNCFPWFFFELIKNNIFAVLFLSDGVDLSWLKLHLFFGFHCAFAPSNKICSIQEVEQWKSIDIYSASKQYWVHLKPLCHAQVHGCLHQL